MNRDFQVGILIPAYNASATICRLLDSLEEYGLFTLVVDDGSSDETFALVESRTSERVRIIRHERNQGKGAAIVSGLKYMQASGLEFGVTMDSDLQHSPEDLGSLIWIATRESLDLLIGARDFNDPGMPAARRLGNWFSSWIATKFCKQAIYDSQSGFRVYRIPAAVDVIEDVRTRNFVFESEFLVRAALKKCRMGFAHISTIYPAEAAHKSHFKPWADTAAIVSMYWKELLRRVFTFEGRKDQKALNRYVENRCDWSRHYLLSGKRA